MYKNEDLDAKCCYECLLVKARNLLFKYFKMTNVFDEQVNIICIFHDLLFIFGDIYIFDQSK